jgi:mannose-1-phosphate guanylyltransferase/mannose-6-phosphate isomerase
MRIIISPNRKEKTRYPLLHGRCSVSGLSFRLQLQHHRSEHWVVVSGTAEIELNGETKILRQGESTFVRSGMRHRLKNPGIIPLEVIEVQLGEYLKEDDIVRFNDDYGRT